MKFNINEKNKKTLIVLGLFAGIVLIILSFFSASNSSGKYKDPAGNIKSNLIITDTETYISALERKLCELLKRVNGVSEPFVMLTLDSSSEYIYASKQSVKESSSKDGEIIQKDIQKDIILYEDEKKSKSPILVKEIQPKIKGVAVICRGISDSNTQLKIINLVSTALNIPANKVYVLSAD